MKHVLAIAVAAGGLAIAASTPTTAEVGQPVPELRPVQWYNAPAMEVGDLKGKAVLLEVFRTW